MKYRSGSIIKGAVKNFGKGKKLDIRSIGEEEQVAPSYKRAVNRSYNRLARGK